MDKQDIIEELRLQNPWWSTEKISLPDHIIIRDLTEKINNELTENKVTCITGLRRVGKTTLLKLTIKELLQHKEAKRLCYFSFDLSEDITPRELIKIYSEEILKEAYSNYKQTVFFFFDEIQKVKNWGNQIKSLQDRELNIKFIITGSSSLNLTKGAGESLAGRVFFHRLQPFCFREYLQYNKIKTPNISLKDIRYVEDASSYRIQFNEYMQNGGLPELYDGFSNEHLKQMLDLVFFRDIVDMFIVKKTDVLKGLFHHITQNSGQLINYSNLADTLNTQYRTIKDYVSYLQDSFLVMKSTPFEKNYLKTIRKNPKMYVSDHAYMRLWNAKEGLKAQTIAFNHLKRLETPYFLKHPEIDIILPKRKLAFEIKYTDNPSKKDAQNLTKAPNDYTLYLITKDIYDEFEIQGRTVYLLPLWLLMLAV